MKCTCKKSRCLKLYCQCFADKKFCQNCKCQNCLNTSQNINQIEKTRKLIISKQPDAFESKILESNV